MNWISVNKEKPKSGEHVFLACETPIYKGRYVCDGFYVERYKEKVDYFNEDCAVEYGEEEDAYYLEEGWYEVIRNWDEFNSIAIMDTVTHWMPMPDLPKEEV